MRLFFTLVATIMCCLWMSSPAGAEEPFVKVDQMPELTYSEPVVYPEAAKKTGICGDVTVKAYIEKTGSVGKAEVVKCTAPGNGLEEAALKAALACKYRPAKQGSQPVAVWVSYKVQFVLSDKK